MSQYPPPPLQQFPPDSGYSAAPRQANGPAIASLVLGILGCIPLVTGLCAVILGIIGLQKSSRDPAASGKGMAVAGLILGILSIVGWGGFGALFGFEYFHYQPGKIAARQFLLDASTGNTNAVMADSTGFTAEQIQAQTRQMNSIGTYQSISFISFNIATTNGQSTMHLQGLAKFSNTSSHICDIDLIKTGGAFKVTSCRLQ